MKRQIDIIGLGAGDIEQLPLGIYRRLTDEQEIIYLRTADHPVVQTLEQEGVRFHAFDGIYEAHDTFSDVYDTIVERLVEATEHGPVVYAVPGHPMMAEKTVQLLLEHPDVAVNIIGGQSFLDDLFTALSIDPIDGFQLIDATEFQRQDLKLGQHIIFGQVYDRMVASNVKLSLLEELPADFIVTIIDAAGTKDEKRIQTPLVELDYDEHFSNLSSVYVPPVPSHLLHHQFSRLRAVIAELRGPNGCPWDQAQTHESLRQYAIEEVYELIEAIDQGDDEGIVEELGDVLLQVMLHSQIGDDSGYFSVDDVIKTLTDKMIHRHPHVFSDREVDTVEEVYQNWDQLKKEEKGATRQSVLDGIPQGLPALIHAYKLQKKAAKVGFDWEDREDVWDKLKEEVAEVKEAIQDGDQEELEKEFGDVLFVVTNLARHYKINPELALNRANDKFTTRFRYIEAKLKEHERDMSQMTLEQFDTYWNEAKIKEKE
ncbi:nucleoside triphosphate pyrophosphohydrolase [Lentibacillus saliphilus]|uniref:nucleoside triphosphate pyrophosphohydrolase n=1 Tax=Lentibacillus saliphilus TaxID=2737028 RepID=UPI001C30F0A3|nr:nucleoside triphosphate pyrophosphohydrolase [Lentibacillus saliphilus]